MAKKLVKNGAAKAAEPAPTMAPENLDAKAAFEAFLPIASAPGAAPAMPFRADPELALQNVQIGVASVLSAEGQIGKELPKVAVAELRSLPALALAVSYAQSRVDRFVADPSQIPALLAEGQPLRAKLLATAESLAAFQLLPAKRVAKIRQGQGLIDAAQDLVALADLFEENAAALRNKSPVSAVEVKRAREVGSLLLTLLKPRGTNKGKNSKGELADSVAARDALWSLLVARHDTLWRTGAYLFGRADVDARVPALQSRRKAPAKKKDAALTAS